MATLFEAYVTNAGKYSEGQLVGETLKFPTTAQEVEALLKRIGVDGVRAYLIGAGNTGGRPRQRRSLFFGAGHHQSDTKSGLLRLLPRRIR